jgi:hypothetical protein
MPVHSDKLLVAKKFYITKPIVAKMSNRLFVGINISVQLLVGMTPLTMTITSVRITL